MAEKYFLFQRNPVTEFSTVASNTGDGLSVLAIPASKLSNVTAQPGEVIMRFDDSGIYDDVALDSKEGMPKTRIDVPCIVGSETQLIEQILTFLTKEGGKSVMRFDSFTNTSTFSLTDFNSRLLSSKIPNQPFTYTGSISNDPLDSGRLSDETTLIAGVRFPTVGLKPLVDYNDTAIVGVSIGAEVGAVNTWANQGSGGASYNLDSNVGTPTKTRSPSDSLLSRTTVNIDTGEALIPANAILVTGAYTVYVVYSQDQIKEMYPLYGDTSTTRGFGAGDASDIMKFGHGNNSSANALAFADIHAETYGTTSGYIQDPRLDSQDDDPSRVSIGPQICYVWVIRRDDDNNMYIHDYTGDVVGFIPTRGLSNGQPVNFATDGNLLINRIGGQGSGLEWSGELARFGVVEDDIGTAEAARIARELFDYHNYYEVK